MRTDEGKLLTEIGELLALHYEDWQVQDAKGPEVAFGRYLRSVRQVKKLTIAEIALKADVAESELLAYEHGLIPKRLIKERSLTALALTLDEEIETFLLLLEADLADKVAPAPSAEPLRKGGHRFFTGASHVSHRTSAPATRAVAASDNSAVLDHQMIVTTTGELTKSLPGTTAAVVRKPSLRQVLGDPRWQLKIYRFWTPLVTLLLFLCLQVQIFHPNWGWQSDGYSTVVAASEVVWTNPTPPLGAFIHPDKMLQNPKSPTKENAKIRETNVKPANSSLGSPPRAVVQAKALPIDGNHNVAPRVEQGSTSLISDGKQTETVAPNSPIEDKPLPVVHMVGRGEVLACISNHYYKEEKFHPLLCLYKFGVLQCSGSLRPGHLFEIPVFEDFQLEDPQIKQALTQLPSGLLNDFKNISREAIYANDTERLRGVDYFCEPGDYENFGEPLVLAGKVANPAERIPGWEPTRG